MSAFITISIRALLETRLEILYDPPNKEAFRHPGQLVGNKKETLKIGMTGRAPRGWHHDFYQLSKANSVRVGGALPYTPAFD